MTRDDIARNLDLLPPDVYRCIATAEYVSSLRDPAKVWDPKLRKAALTVGTGRSTQVLVAALEAVSEGKRVRIAAVPPEWQHKMVMQARAWAERLSLQPALIRGARESQLGCDDLLFLDHDDDDLLFVDHERAGE